MRELELVKIEHVHPDYYSLKTNTNVGYSDGVIYLGQSRYSKDFIKDLLKAIDKLETNKDEIKK